MILKKVQETKRRQEEDKLETVYNKNSKWLINNEETSTKTDKQAGFFFRC